MNAMECLKGRRSVRSYKAESVPKEVIEDIVDAGRLAATAMNLQPWQFVVITDADSLSHIAELTDHGRFLAKAPVCIAVFCEDGKYYLEDGSAATQNMLNAAYSHGLGSCWVAGDKKPYADRVREYLDVPENYKLISLIPIGPTDHVATIKKKPLSSVLHWERYGL